MGAKSRNGRTLFTFRPRSPLDVDLTLQRYRRRALGWRLHRSLAVRYLLAGLSVARAAGGATRPKQAAAGA